MAIESGIKSMQKTLRFWLLILSFSISTATRAADFNVTAPANDFFYTINNQAPDPTLTLTRGQTYTFQVNTDSSHPFAITTDFFPVNTPPGVSNNDIFSGTITYVVPMDAPDTLFYVCSLHFFGGMINIVDPLPPPAPNVKIISVSLTSSNVTLISTGTNGWTGIPEFSSNLFLNNWTVVPGYSNTFVNGTNTALFDRLEAICGPNVFLRVRNTPN
jgi:hypothetical protein